MSPKLTHKQQNILNMITRLTRKRSMPPTLQEIGDELSIQPPTVLQHVMALERKGYVAREPGRPRSIRVIHGGEDVADCVDVPVKGVIAAGRPILAVAESGKSLRLHRGMVKGRGEVYALKVKGDSMKDAAILDGDYIIVRRQDRADNGDVVVALLGEEATVKRFQRKKDGIYLMPANEKVEPIRVADDGLSIQGKVIAIHRQVAA